MVTKDIEKKRKKILVAGISLLFIITAITPSINFNIVKASNNNDFVEVTTQACGIKGFGNTTVKLTREQCQNLEQYLVEFRARLNQTTTREEAVPIFKEAVVELNKYGLLPKGMSVEQAQKFISGERFHPILQIFLKKILVIQNKNSNISNDVINLLCYFYAHTKYAFEDNIWVLIALFFQHISYKYDLKIFSVLDLIFQLYSQNKPFRSMNRIWVPGPSVPGITYSYFTLGLLGIQKGGDDFGIAYGFSGIKLILDSESEAIYFGFTFMATT